MQLLQQLEIVPPSGAERSGGPFPDAVNSEDRRLLEGRREERAGRVRLVMLGVEHFAVVAEGLSNLAVLKEFFFHPRGSREAELRKAAGCHPQIGLEDAAILTVDGVGEWATASFGA